MKITKISKFFPIMTLQTAVCSIQETGWHPVFEDVVVALIPKSPSSRNASRELTAASSTTFNVQLV
jgi:hypothetical protein